MCVVRLVRCLDCSVVYRPELYNSTSSETVVLMHDVICNNSGCQRVAIALRLAGKHAEQFLFADCLNPTCMEDECRLDFVSASCLNRWAYSTDNVFPIRTSLSLPGQFFYEFYFECVFLG